MKEDFKVSGEDLVRKIKELIAEGNVRRVSVKGKDGKVIAEFPMTVGVMGALIAPALAAVGAIAALVAECTVTVERNETE